MYSQQISSDDSIILGGQLQYIVVQLNVGIDCVKEGPFDGRIGNVMYEYYVRQCEGQDSCKIDGMAPSSLLL